MNTTTTTTTAATATATTKPRDIVTAIDSTTLTITCANGEGIVIDTRELTSDLRIAAMMHGLKQKICDAAALSRNPDTGRSATIDDKYRAMLEVADRLRAGRWNKPSEGSSSPKGGLLFAALCRFRPEKSVEALREWLDGQSTEQQAALRGNARIAAIIETIKAERAAKRPDVAAVDTDAMLGDLDNI